MESEGTPLVKAAAAGELETLQELLATTDVVVNSPDEKGDTALHAACANGHVAVVRWLLDNGARLGSRNKEGDSVVHAAATCGDGMLVDTLTEAGFEDVDVKNKQGWTPAHMAVRSGSMEVLLRLVDHGADLKGTLVLHIAASVGNVDAILYFLDEVKMEVNMLSVLRRSALHEAAAVGAVEAVQELLMRGADTDIADSYKRTPLSEAAVNGHGPVVELLVSQGAEVNVVDDRECTPLHHAAQLGDMEMIKLLVERGADLSGITQDEQSMLHMATASGSCDAVKFFLDRGLDIDATDTYNNSPLISAALRGHGLVVQLLLKAGADVNAVENRTSQLLCGVTLNDDVETIKLLVEHGADIHLIDPCETNMLQVAAGSGAVKAVKFFLESGLEIEATNSDGETALYEAARGGRRSVVEFLLDVGADVNARQGDGWSPLQGAVYADDVEMMKLLIERGADVHCTTKNQGGLLHFAAWKGSTEAVKYLLESGLDINAVNAHGETPLQKATDESHQETVELLLKAGAKVIVDKENSWISLRNAAQWGDINTIELLAKSGVDLNSVTPDGENMLHITAGVGSLNAVKYFLDKGLKINLTDKVGKTPLVQAARGGHRAVVEFLLNAGADVNTRDADGREPLHSAAESGDVETIKLLVERGANLSGVAKNGLSALVLVIRSRSEEAIDFILHQGLTTEVVNQADEEEYTALHCAADNRNIKAMKMLLEIGADVDATKSNGWSALQISAQANDVEAVELLLKNGANIDAKDESGKSVLQAAIDYARDSTAKVLLSEGADVNAIEESNGWSALHYAVARGYPELVKLLRERGANMNAIAKDGKTALHMACSSNRIEMIKYLLGTSVDVNAVDEDGRTALHYLVGTEGSGCVASLLEAGAKDSIDQLDKDGYRPLHLTAKAHFIQETTELLEAGADVCALTNDGESPLQLAVFAESGSAALSTVMILCSFGADWTSKCEEQLTSMKAEVEASELDAADERFQQLQWCAGLRTCILHWGKQHRDGVKELIKVPIEVVERGPASVRTYVADATSSNTDQLVYQCKVCVVGPSEWGKSSLVRSIETMKPFLVDAKDRTVGIELVPTSFGGLTKTQCSVEASTTPEESDQVTESVVSSPNAERSRQDEVTFWDFAGQDVYSVAHSLFFSRRTLYVLVVDAHAYLKQLDAVESLRPAAAEAAMDRFLSRFVFRWVRTIFARQPDAEFLVLGTKADLLSDEKVESMRVWRDLQSRVYQWKLIYMREIEEEFGVVTKASGKFTGRTVTNNQTTPGFINARIRELTEKLARLASDKWLVVSVTRSNSIVVVRDTIQRTIEASERGFPMWNKYSRVQKAIAAKRLASNRPGDGRHRLEHGMMLFRPLCAQLMDEVEGLEYDECREILRTLHDLGDVIWYENQEAGELRDFIILDPMLVIDIVREVISHEHKKKSGVSIGNSRETEEKPRIDGRVSHSLLETFPLWRHMDKELMYAFKMLLKRFQLAYPADDEVMDPESDLIVPSYWKAQMEAVISSGARSVPAAPASANVVTRPNHHCWEYEVSADLADSIFEQFAVQSYTSFMKREVRANCIESSCAEFDSWITLHPGMTKYDVIRVEVASENADIAWLNMRYYLMKLEKVLDGYSGLAVPRYVVVNGERNSLSPATKAIRDSIMMGLDVNALRMWMPWLPPDLDWFMNRAWRDIAAFQELQMMHLVRDKLNVLQKLVVKSDSQRRYPALWSLEYKAEERAAVLRMLSDLSGRCYHVPIEIKVPPAFLAKHGSKLKEGISLLANILPSSLSAAVVKMAFDGLDTKTQQAAEVHNLIESMDLATTTGTAMKTSNDLGLSPGGTMAILRDLLKLHNDSLDELSITEICNLECAATSKGEYVWAHAHEINMLKKELTPCQPRFESDSASATSTSSVPQNGPQSVSRSPSKLRLRLCIETVTGLADWDWYKTYCTWQLFYGDRSTPLAAGATATNTDSNVQPSWSSLKMSLDAIESVEMLQECRLVVGVKRLSRIGWTKLIGEGQVKLRPFVSGDAKLGFSCDPIEVQLPSSGSTSTKRLVVCHLSGSS